jgi:hypothetical protein
MPISYSLASAKEAQKTFCIDQINNALSSMVYGLQTECNLSFPKNPITDQILNGELVAELIEFGFYNDLTEDGSNFYLKVSMLPLA